jgi:glutamyl-Q tRNA(Asp) synthetase
VASFLFARAAGGRWLVRIEDLDAPRVLPGCAEEQIALLARFGLVSDAPILRQSLRRAAYDRAFETLTRRGAVYPCRCSRREVAEAASAPQGAPAARYPGTCRERSIEPGQVRAWRLRVPPGSISFTDSVFGRVAGDVAVEIGDFVVARERPVRSYAYQLAVVVDDAFQRVTQVVRGADLLDSTPRQIVLGRELGLAIPRYAHVPVVVSRSGAKLSKRAGARALAEAAARGREGEALSAVLSLLGQPSSLSEAVAGFDHSRIPVAPEIEVPQSFDDVS